MQNHYHRDSIAYYDNELRKAKIKAHIFGDKCDRISCTLCGFVTLILSLVFLILIYNSYSYNYNIYNTAQTNNCKILDKKIEYYVNNNKDIKYGAYLIIDTITNNKLFVGECDIDKKTKCEMVLGSYPSIGDSIMFYRLVNNNIIIYNISEYKSSGLYFWFITFSILTTLLMILFILCFSTKMSRQEEIDFLESEKKRFVDAGIV
jgi:hypothetical protein